MPRSDQHSGEPTLVPGKLTAYRTWQFVGDHITANNGTPWPVGTFIAKCNKYPEGAYRVSKPFNYYDDPDDSIVELEKHIAPVDGCTCGIYARWKPNDLLDQAYGLHSGGHTNAIAGAIEISGMMLPGWRGVRVQYARILAICPIDPFDLSDELPKLAARYHSYFFNSMRDLVAAFPPANLSALGIDTNPPSELDFLDERLKLIGAYTNMTGEQVKEAVKQLTVAFEQQKTTVPRNIIVTTSGPPIVTSGSAAANFIIKSTLT